MPHLELDQPKAISSIAADFPILSQLNHNQLPLVYLDNAATTQKPQQVIDCLNRYYGQQNANVHRAAHFLSDRATQAFEQARDQVQQFLGAKERHEIIWTRGTTEAINLVANSWGAEFLKPGDLIVLSELEHHANIVPWQLIAARTGATIEAIRLTEDHQLDLEHYQQLLTRQPKIVALSHVSNAIGTINPIQPMIQLAKAAGAVTLIDGAQGVSHFAIDVQQLDCDFYVFSGHKLFGPTGIGVLYGKQQLLAQMPPWQGGGEMIEQVSFSGTRFNQLPFKFEAGTPHIAGAIGLASAIDYLKSFDRVALANHEQQLFNQTYDWLLQQPHYQLHSPKQHNAGVIAFNLKGEHHQDVGTLLDQQGIAVRTGHHCAMPLMAVLGVTGTIRVSFSIYNQLHEVNALTTALTKVSQLLD